MESQNDVPHIKSVGDAKKLIKKLHLDPGSESHNRQLLDDGLQLIKHRMEYNEQLGLGLDINSMGGWITQFIRDQLGAIIRDMKIVWILDDKTIIWDPSTGEVNDVNDGDSTSAI